MKSSTVRIFVTIFLVLSTQTGLALASGVERGRAFVETNCSKCHAIGRHDESAVALAPSFRTLHENYPVENLEEALAEGIVTGHPAMPEFQLDGAQISDLVTYLKTLE